jgi:hypothetical protein
MMTTSSVAVRSDNVSLDAATDVPAAERRRFDKDPGRLIAGASPHIPSGCVVVQRDERISTPRSMPNVNGSGNQQQGDDQAPS